MIHQFFGLREQPFGVTPDPRYLYFGTGHREALASLVCGIETNRGFLALIARPGMGKTTLLFHLLKKFRHSAHTAFLFQTQCSSRELLHFLLAEFGIESKKNDLMGMHQQFNRYLIEQSSIGNRVLVVIDEAQNLEPSVLETVRLLSNFETPRAKLLQIILAGQPELATKLAGPSLSQLRQRIASFNGLDPLASQEVARFIDHRLRVARYQGPPLFSDKAKSMIADLSEGIPRNINSLCFGALSLACALSQQTIGPEIVNEVSRDLDLQKLIPHSQHVPLPNRSAAWSSLLQDPTLASSSQAFVGSTEASPTPTGVVAFSGTQSDRDGASHPREITNAPAKPKSPGPMFKKPGHTLVSIAVAFAVFLLIMIGKGSKQNKARAVEFANTRPRLNSDDVAPPNIVKTSEGQAVRLEPAKTPPEQVANPTDPAELSKRVNEGSASRESRLAPPGVETANTRPGPDPETVTAPGMVKMPAPEAVSVTTAKTQLRQVHNSTVDASELPKRVKEGSVSRDTRGAASVLETANARPRPHPENAETPAAIKSSETEAVRLATAKTQPEQVQNPTADPAELWKRVQEGSTDSEIRLATLYLEGKTVEQNCEQAHLLLVAASKKGSKVASDLLNGKYAERCH